MIKHNMKRPLLLSIISIIQGLFAPLYFIVLISRAVDLPVGIIISYTYLLLFPVSSYGLWTQRKWGWWIGVILYGKIIWGNVIALIHTLIIMHGFGSSEIDAYISTIWQEIIPQTALLLIVFGYMFSANVLDCYNLRKIKVLNLLLIMLGLSLLIYYLWHWFIVLPLS